MAGVGRLVMVVAAVVRVVVVVVVGVVAAVLVVSLVVVVTSVVMVVLVVMIRPRRGRRVGLLLIAAVALAPRSAAPSAAGRTAAAALPLPFPFPLLLLLPPLLVPPVRLVRLGAQLRRHGLRAALAHVPAAAAVPARGRRQRARLARHARGQAAVLLRIFSVVLFLLFLIVVIAQDLLVTPATTFDLVRRRRRLLVAAAARGGPADKHGLGRGAAALLLLAAGRCRRPRACLLLRLLFLPHSTPNRRAAQVAKLATRQAARGRHVPRVVIARAPSTKPHVVSAA